ncbi:hypothetical protein ABK040_001011 [Willaertia magna]
MQKFKLLTTVFLLVTVLSTFSFQLTTFERSILVSHNKYRRSKLIRPRPRGALPQLKWSKKLANTARKWAKRCNFSHNPNRGNSGENIDASFGMKGNVGSQAVLSWFKEYKDYNYRSNKCKSGKMCGHYTQLVWRKTRFVGCAIVKCRNLKKANFKNATFVVCNYSPPGNFVGRKPY